MRMLWISCWTVATALGCSASHLSDGDGAVEEVLDGASAELDGGIDAAPPRLDAGEPTREIACGEDRCAARSQGCLASCTRDGGLEPACLPRPDGEIYWSGECPRGEQRYPVLWLTCDGPEDCSLSERCTLTHGSLGDYVHCGCDADDGCDLGYAGVLCHSDADCPSVAPRCAIGELADYPTCSADP